jgi:HSP20 family protein
MNMVRYRDRPTGLNLHNELRRVVDRMFDGGGFEQDASDESSIVTSQWTPRVDILEEPERFVLLADLPGIDPADIEVSMDDGILTIKGERKSETASRTDRFSRLERSYGIFHRRFALPGSADAQGISAQGRNGVLEVSIPKRPETTPRRIQVNHLGGGRVLENQAAKQ